MDNKKIYVGSGKEFGQYGQVGINICLSDLPKEHIFTGKTGKKYIKLNVCKKKEVDQYGKSHYVAVDTWKPNQNQAPQMTGNQGDIHNTGDHVRGNKPTNNINFDNVDPNSQDYVPF